MNKLKELIKSEKKNNILIFICLGAVLLIVLSTSFSGNDKTINTTDDKDLKKYETEIEESLTEILKKIENIGEVNVFVMLDSGSQNIYVYDEESDIKQDESSNSSSYSRKHFLNNNSNNALLEKEVAPKIRGVIVVCSGADNLNVKDAVIKSVTAGLGISTARVSVVKGE